MKKENISNNRDADPNREETKSFKSFLEEKFDVSSKREIKDVFTTPAERAQYNMTKEIVEILSNDVKKGVAVESEDFVLDINADISHLDVERIMKEFFRTKGIENLEQIYPGIYEDKEETVKINIDIYNGSITHHVPSQIYCTITTYKKEE